MELSRKIIPQKTRRLFSRKATKQDLNLIIILAACFIIGIIVGALASKSGAGTMQSYVSYLTRSNIENGKTLSFFSLVLNASAPFALMLIIVVLSSYCAFGTPLILVVSVAYGACVGMGSTYLYYYLGSKGIIYNLILVFPVIIAATIVIFKVSAAGVKLSTAILLYATGKQKREVKPLVSEHSALLIKAAIVIALCGVFQAAAIKAVGGLFV